MSSAGLSVIRVPVPAAASSLSAEGDEADGGVLRSIPQTDPQKILKESFSSIQVKRVTKHFHYIPVVAAESPFITFGGVQSAFNQKNTEQLQRLCIGVVSRKSDPKQSMKGGGVYGVINLWNMSGISPNSSNELAFLVCGAAFQRHYNMLCLGQVVAVDKLDRIRSSSSGSSLNPSFLLRVEDPQCMRLLGTAADFGSCEGTNRKTGERCSALINRQLSQRCAYHFSQKSSNVTTREKTSAHASSGMSTTVVGAHGRPGLMYRSNDSVGLNAAAGARSAATSGSAASAFSSMGKRVVGRLPTIPIFTVSGKTGKPSSSVLSSRPGSTALGGSGGVYSAARGDTLVISDKVAPVPVTMGSSRGRATLMAAAMQEQDQGRRELLKRALCSSLVGPSSTGASLKKEGPLVNLPSTVAAPKKIEKRKRAREVDKEGGEDVPIASHHASTVPSTPTDPICELQSQFAPLHRNVSGAFQPATVSAGIQVDTTAYTSSAKKGSSSKHPSGLLRNVALHLAKEHVRSGFTLSSPSSSHGTTNGSSPSVLVQVAAELESSHTALVQKAEKDQLLGELDRYAAQEAVRQAQEHVEVEEGVPAYLCCSCKRWFPRVPDSCRMAHHRIEQKKTNRYYVQCGHCGFKAAVLGDTNQAYSLLPSCPRCHGCARWQKGNAAPELKGERQFANPSAIA